MRRQSGLLAITVTVKMTVIFCRMGSASRRWNVKCRLPSLFKRHCRPISSDFLLEDQQQKDRVKQANHDRYADLAFSLHAPSTYGAPCLHFLPEHLPTALVLPFS